MQARQQSASRSASYQPKGKQMLDMQTENTQQARRGRQPGTKVESLDYRAFKALRKVNFEKFVDRAGAEDDDQWRDELIDTIITALRAGDNPIF